MKRTYLLETYLPVGTFRNELFYVTGPRIPFTGTLTVQRMPDLGRMVEKGTKEVSLGYLTFHFDFRLPRSSP